MKIADIATIRRALPLPPLLVALIHAGRWVHPGTDQLRAAAPFIQDPLVVLPSLESMLFNSEPLMGSSDTENEVLHEYRGSVFRPRDLPWIDVEKTIFIMCNERIGDDCGIALDYRINPKDPRVIGSDWHTGINGVRYKYIADSFADFVARIGLPTISTGA